MERFDLPLLAREFSDAGIKFEYANRTVYDAQKIYHLHERRDLFAAFAFYCKQELKDTHILQLRMPRQPWRSFKSSSSDMPLPGKTLKY